jgi:hypothetical protein
MAFYSGFQLLAGLEGHHPTCSYGNFFTRFGITSRSGTFVAQIEIAKTRKFYRIVRFQRRANFLKEIFENLLGFALVEPQLNVQQLCNIGFSER